VSVATETVVKDQVRTDESARLAAVRRYDILDTPPDGAFDRITAMAARLFKAPIAIVSIVDHDRIWFKSHHGLDVTEIGRDPGLCASAIMQADPYVLPDAKLDPRSLANPLVAGDFGLRFYAAAPLRTSDGFNLGTLCVIDKEPRPISAEDIAQLQDLASVVMDQMELRRSARAALASKDAVVEKLAESERSLSTANARLSDEGEGIRRLFEQAPGLVTVLRGPDHVVELANAATRAFVGQRDMVGKTVRDAFRDLEGQGFFELIDQVYASGEVFVGRSLPILIDNDEGGGPQPRFLDLVYQPLFDGEGLVSGVFVDGHDVTEHLEAEKALLVSEARFRTLADAMPQLVWTAHPDGAIHWYNQGWYLYTGTTPELMEGWGWQSVHDPEVLPSVMARWQASIATGDPFEMTFPLRGADGIFRPFLTRVMPQKDDQGRVLQWYGTNTDVDELRRAEEKQDLLLKEMDHRVKNLFAIVGGIVALSARTATTPRELAEAIQGRLGALASAHQLVRVAQVGSASDQRETTLDDLVRTILAPYFSSARIGDAARVVTEGPQVAIGGNAMTSFALVFHELATNAAKYGALSEAGGQVAISWAMGEGELQIVWRERGGPAVKAVPKSEGFGSLLARNSIHGQLGGDLAYDWDPGGLIVRLSAAAERLGA
jgi:PAS domain S-box-containing protein